MKRSICTSHRSRGLLHWIHQRRTHLAPLLCIATIIVADVTSADSIPRIEVFVASRCRQCDELEDYLSNAQIPYRRIDLENDPTGERDYLDNIGRGILPVARINGINGTVIRGFDSAEWKSIERSIGDRRRPPSSSNAVYEQKQLQPDTVRRSFDDSGNADSRSQERPQNSRQSASSGAYDQTRTTSDVRIQFVRQGNGRVAGIDGIEVLFAVAGQVYRTKTNQFGVAEAKELPCDQGIKVTSPDFSKMLPRKSWEAAGSLSCLANNRETDLGVYSNFAGQKVSETKVNAIGLSRDVTIPAEFSDSSVAEKRDAADPKPMSPMERQIKTIAMLLAMGKPIDALQEDTPAYKVASACFEEMYGRIDKNVITKDQAKLTPLLARAYCACLISGIEWDELTDNAVEQVIQTLPYDVDYVLKASDATQLQKITSAKLFKCVLEIDQQVAK